MEAVTITPGTGLPPNLDFYSLRTEGISLLQELSGDTWTDYNIHDPGVTILEHLCYALTELGYKTNQDINEIIVPSPGNTFFPANKILTTRPVTINDYRKYLLDCFPDLINNCWIDCIIPDGFSTGFYKVDVRMTDKWYSGHNDYNEMVRKIRKLLNRNRNIGEFFVEVTILEPQKIQLSGVFEISHDADENKVLAEIYHRAQEIILPGIIAQPLHKLEQAGMSYQKIFEGPLLKNGFIQDKQLKEKATKLTRNDVLMAIMATPGIIQVKEFSLSIGKTIIEHEIPVKQGEVFIMEGISEDRTLSKVKLHKGKVPVKINSILVEKYTKILTVKENQQYKTSGEIEKVFGLEKKQQQDLESYYSIQNDFPVNYGLGKRNSFGSDTYQQAAVKQLKGFLLLAEQLVANYQSQLAAAQQLLSTDITSDRKSYFFQNIDSIPSLDSVINKKQYSHKQLEIYKYLDRFAERQSEILDHQLARFGEKFPDTIHNKLELYFTHEQVQQHLLEHKIAFLKNIVVLSAARMAAPFYSSFVSASCVSPLQSRLNLQLGIFSSHLNIEKMLTDIGILSINNSKEFETAGSYIEYKKGEGIFGLNKHDNIFSSFEYSPDSIFNKPHFLIPRHFLHSGHFLRNGINFRNYYCKQVSGTTAKFELYYRPPYTSNLYMVAKFNDFNVLLFELNTLTNYLRAINIATETYTIIEHLLLLPKENASELKKSPYQDIPLSFFCSAITVVFPAWTKRFDNAEFQKTAESIIVENMPAHLHIRVLWLNYDDYMKYEIFYHQWLKVSASGNLPETNIAAKQLASFLYGMITK